MSKLLATIMVIGAISFGSATLLAGECNCGRAKDAKCECSKDCKCGCHEGKACTCDKDCKCREKGSCNCGKGK